MKKYLLGLLMCLVLVAMVAACNNDSGTTPVDPPTAATEEVVVPPAPPTDPATEDPTPAPPTEVVASSESDRDHVVIRATIRPTENIAWARWENAGVNSGLRELMWGFRSTMSRNMDDEWFPNPTVMVDGAWPVITDNADGSRTYTFEIYTTNTFSDGRPITAWDYAGDIAFHTSPQWAAVPGPAITANANEVVGRHEWEAGEVPTLTGVRVYSDSSFSVTVGAEFVPFTWEVSLLMDWGPFPVHALGIEVHDDGDGVFLTAIGGGELTNDAVLVAVNGGNYQEAGDDTPASGDGFRFNPTVFVGPYMFHSVDVGAAILQAQRNPNFGYTWDGYTPRIEYLIWREVLDPVLIDSLAAGEVDMTIGQGQGAIINSALETLVQQNGTHTFLPYNRHGFGQILFHADHGPTQFVEVRQAIMWLIDRDVFGEMFTEGHGNRAEGPYSTAWWWHNEAVARGMYDRMTMYTFNMAEAIRLLEEGGWVYAADGSPFVGPGTSDNIRHKMVDGELMPLRIEWATFSSQNRITDIINILMPEPLTEAGFYLNETRMATPLAYMNNFEQQGTGDRYNMFNLGAGFAAIWTPWNSHDAAMGPQWNWTQIDDPHLVELANRMRFLDLTTDAGRDAMVEAYMDFMVYLNYLVIQIPLYIDIFYDFVPTWIGNWHNNSIWGGPQALVRAYIR